MRFTATVTIEVDEVVDIEDLKDHLAENVILDIDDEEEHPEGLGITIDWESLKPEA